MLTTATYRPPPVAGGAATTLREPTTGQPPLTRDERTLVGGARMPAEDSLTQREIDACPLAESADRRPSSPRAATGGLRGVAAAASLLLHLSLLLVLAAWLLPLAPRSRASVITTTMGNRQDADELRNSIQPDAADAAALDSPSDRLFVVTPMVAVTSDPAAEELDALLAGMVSAASAEFAGAMGEGDGRVRFFGTEAVGQSFVFIVDCSGSMQGYRFSRARTELNRALGDLAPWQKFYVIFYNHGTIPLPQSGSRSGLVFASRNEVYRARRWISKREAGGGTVPDGAIELALGMRPDVIYLLSDGKFARTARVVAKEHNAHGTIIHTIAFQYQESEPLLKGIAADNSGRYRFVE